MRFTLIIRILDTSTSDSGTFIKAIASTKYINPGQICYLYAGKSC